MRCHRTLADANACWPMVSPWRKPLAIAVAMMWICGNGGGSGGPLLISIIRDIGGEHTLPLKLVARSGGSHNGLQLLAVDLLHYNLTLLFNQRRGRRVVQQLRSDH